jgi:hypothetical protein
MVNQEELGQITARVNLAKPLCRCLAWLLGGGAGAVQDAGGGADVHVQGDAVVGVAGHADTSVASSFQVNRAVVQNTCRRLCQVQAPLPCSSRHPAAR